MDWVYHKYEESNSGIFFLVDEQSVLVQKYAQGGIGGMATLNGMLNE